jgi:protein SSD1
MTDEQQDTSNKEKPTPIPASGTNRGQRRNPSVPRPSNSTAQPSKSGGNKKPGGTPATESGSENGKKANDVKKNEQRRQPQNGGGQGKANHRKGQSTASQNSRNNNNGQSSNKPGTPAPPPPESSDALSSLQRVIADLKTTSPPASPAPLAGNTVLSPPRHLSRRPHSSNLPANAPVFQPGASIYIKCI